MNDVVEIELRDYDENIIKPFKKRIWIEKSPFTNYVTVNKGEYTFIIYKCRSTRTISNTGEYKFKFEEIDFE